MPSAHLSPPQRWHNSAWPASRCSAHRRTPPITDHMKNHGALHIGIKVMALAGYDIRVAPRLWDDLRRCNLNPDFLDRPAAAATTHPSVASRKESLEAEVWCM